MATKYEKAWQVFPVLRLAARQRTTITYGDLATACGGISLMGRFLGPIQAYCEVEGLPPITVLVVNEHTGEPGDGYRPRKTVALDREAVYNHNWFPRWAGKRLAPTAKELEQAEVEAYLRRGDEKAS